MPRLSSTALLRDLGPALTAGVLTALATLTYALAHAALIFRGDLAAHLDQAVSMAVLGAIVSLLVVGLRGSLPFLIGGTDSSASAVLAVMASTVLATGLPPGAGVATVTMLLALAALGVGATLWLLGALRQGHLVRFVPYPVIGGFLAGTGWLIIAGALRIMAGEDPGLDWLSLRLWLPGVLFGAVLLLATWIWPKPWVLPLAMLLVAAGFHLVLVLSGTTTATAVAAGWLFRPLEHTPTLFVWSDIDLRSIHWPTILGQWAELLAMTGVVVLTLLLNATGIELATARDLDLDRELRSAGAANLLAGGLGGLLGLHSLSRTVLNVQAGGRSRLAGLIAAALSLIVLLGAAPVLSAIPRLALGGFLIYVGLRLLLDWVIRARHTLSRTDYLLVQAIMLTIALVGFLPGIGLGLALSMVLFVFSYSKVRVIKHELTLQEQRSSLVRPAVQQRTLDARGGAVRILSLQGYLFFGTAHGLSNRLEALIMAEPDPPVLRHIILDGRLLSGLDASAMASLHKILRLTAGHGIGLYLTDLPPVARHQMALAGLLGGDDESSLRLYDHLDPCVQHCEDAVLRSAGCPPEPDELPIAQQLADGFLSTDQVPAFLHYLEPVDVDGGTLVCRQGDPAASLYFVVSGRVHVQITAPDGTPIRLLTQGPGTLFGEMGLYSGGRRSADVVAERPTRLYELRATALERMQLEAPGLASALHRYVIGLLAERVGRANRQLQRLS